MYIPIGNDMAVRDRSIIGIFDMDNCSWSYRTREFLRQAEEKGEIIPATDDFPKTFLVSTEYGMNKVYLIKFTSTVIEHRRIQ